MSEEPPAGLGPPPYDPPDASAGGGTRLLLDDPLVPSSFGGWCDGVLGVWRRSWRTLWRLHAIAAVASALYWALAGTVVPRYPDLEYAVMANQAPLADVLTYLVTGLGSGVVSFGVGAFVWGASVFVAIRDAAGRPTTARQGLRFAARRALPLIGWWLIAGLLIAIGLVMLVVPGLMLLVLFRASLLAVVVVERRGAGRSMELASGRFWPTAGRMLVVGFAWELVAAVVDVVVNDELFPMGAGIALGEFARANLMVPVNILLTGVAVVTYAELRGHDDGCTTSALAEQLDAR